MSAPAAPPDPSTPWPPDPTRDAEWRDATGEGLMVLYGAGAAARLGARAESLGGRSALLVTDPGVRAAGHCGRVEEVLKDAGLACLVFDAVEPNPTEISVRDGVEAARGAGVDLVVAVGGGSAMDCAKAVNLVLTNGGAIADYEGRGGASRPTLPSIGIPTTAGTGSEAQSYALISAAATHRKMACGDPAILFDVAVLDPSLLATAPKTTAAATGLDAMAHALESYVAGNASRLSRRHAAQAWRYLEPFFEAALAAPADVASAGAMQLGSHFAGAAIEASMLGAAHSLANPLTARYATTHGFAVALMLPHVIRFNAGEVGAAYAELARLMHEPGDDAESLARRFEAARDAAAAPARLRDAGVDRDDLADLAREAADQWTLRFNPRNASIDDLQTLYETAY